MKKIKYDIIGLSISSFFVWIVIVILSICDKVQSSILIAAGIILPILLIINIFSYNNYNNYNNYKKRK